MTTSDLVASLKKNPLLFACGVLSLALAAGIYFRSDAIADATTDLDAKSAEGRRYTANLTNAAQLKEQLDALLTANKEIQSRMIHASDLGINQQYFFKLESESGVKLTDLHQGGRGSAGKAGFLPISFSVTMQGDFNQVMTFLRLLEDGTHYCRVVTATCNGQRKGPVTMSLNLELLGTP